MSLYPVGQGKECPYCDGSGAIPHVYAECCGRPTQSGECCGNAVAACELEQCQWCDENNRLIEGKA